ncbi:putative knottin, scorpion toxin, defensin, plant, knottin, scorpion toxin-like superfamily [Helianthus annuus]|nr:putative knottin, scorpion toxin, defensin, plant, knottin, scorpion toxin-like superfamily [Helianthus annuus]
MIHLFFCIDAFINLDVQHMHMHKSYTISMEKISSSILLLLLFLLVSFKEETMINVAEARICESQSQEFHGSCMSNHNCGLVCRTEGFSAGICRGVRGRCFCLKTC